MKIASTSRTLSRRSLVLRPIDDVRDTLQAIDMSLKPEILSATPSTSSPLDRRHRTRDRSLLTTGYAYRFLVVAEADRALARHLATKQRTLWAIREEKKGVQGRKE